MQNNSDPSLSINFCKEKEEGYKRIFKRSRMNIVWSRLLPDGCSPSTVTVKLEPSGRWFVSLLVEDPTVRPLPQTDKKVGIDVGISSLLCTSDGKKIANPKYFNRLYQKLSVAQKELSRKTKGSLNRYKARLKVAKIHGKIKDARTDFLHNRNPLCGAVSLYLEIRILNPELG